MAIQEGDLKMRYLGQNSVKSILHKAFLLKIQY